MNSSGGVQLARLVEVHAVLQAFGPAPGSVPAASHHDMSIPAGAVAPSAAQTRYVRRRSQPSVASVSESPSERHGTTPFCCAVHPLVASGAASTPALFAVDASVPSAGHGRRFCVATNWISAASTPASRVVVVERFCAA